MINWGEFTCGICDCQINLQEDSDECRDANKAADQQDPKDSDSVAQREFQPPDDPQGEA